MLVFERTTFFCDFNINRNQVLKEKLLCHCKMADAILKISDSSINRLDSLRYFYVLVSPFILSVTSYNCKHPIKPRFLILTSNCFFFSLKLEINCSLIKFPKNGFCTAWYLLEKIISLKRKPNYTDRTRCLQNNCNFL